MGDELEVSRGYPSDQARGIVRIPWTKMDRWGSEPGDTVAVHGKRTTFGRCEPLDRLDPENMVRMDAFMRLNAAVTLGESLVIQPAGVQPAHSVGLSPPTEQPHHLDVEWLASNQTLLVDIPDRFTSPLEEEASLESKSAVLDVVHQRIVGRPVTPGDIVPVRLDRTGLTILLLTVEKTDSDGPTRITSETHANIEASN